MKMFGENFPYTNFHDLNLDWIIGELKKQTDFLNNELGTYIEEKIQEIGVSLVVDYEASTETLIFSVSIDTDDTNVEGE